MGRLVKEIHQMVRKLHQETGEQNKNQNPFSQQASSTFEDKVSKSTPASKRGVEAAVYHDPVEEKIDEILAMIR